MSQPQNNHAALSPAPPCVAPAPVSDQSQWFTKEVHPHDGQLKAWLRNQFPTVRDVDDLVQESYLRIWKVRATEEIHSAKTFLYLIARRLALDHIRRQRASPIDFRAEFKESSALGSEANGADALTTQELLRLLGDALISLPDHYREVIIFHKLQGLSQKETADRMLVKPRFVEKCVQRALVKIGKYLRAHHINGLSR